MPTNTLHRNGTGVRHFPRTPLLLAPVALPFHGDYAGITINFDVAAVRALLDDDGAGLHALSTDLEAQEAALDAPDAEAALDALETVESVRAAIWLESAHRVIARAVHSVEWPWDDAPPDPKDADTWAALDPQVVCWIAQVGLGIAGSQFAGPFVPRMRRSASWSIMASLQAPPSAS